MNAKNNIKLRKDLDRAIEQGNIDDIKNIMENIPDCIPPVSARELADRIMSVNKEVRPMKNKISKRVFIAAALIAVAACVSVSAGVVLKSYLFEKDGKFVSVISNAGLSNEEAEAIADDSVKENITPSNEENTLKPQSFDSIEEAEKTLDMEIALPAYNPLSEPEEITGARRYLSDKSSYAEAWVVYGDVESKIYGITVTKNDFEDEEVTGALVTDSRMTGEEFTSDSGFKYNILTDSNESGDKVAYIYITYIGDYEYSMNFYGFDKSEMEKIVNSVDLSGYAK